jgi:hypothetical protein
MWGEGFLPEPDPAQQRRAAEHLAIPNVTLLEAPWMNHNDKMEVVCPCPEVMGGYALPLKGPGLGISFDEAMTAQPFVPARLAVSERAAGIGARILRRTKRGKSRVRIPQLGTVGAMKLRTTLICGRMEVRL